ncbi:MAG TPA: TlpA disulfide reductase family protein [Polyangiaceae bacterium]|nr:TlpA disulfide reductase family protein [Polyangiaceae bacterium]
MSKLFRLLRVIGAGTALFASLGCGREAKPGAERKPQAAAAAAAAPSTASSATAENENFTGRLEGQKDSGGTQADPNAPLTQVTAGELLALMRASGRKATLVNAWASWCGPCRRELPMLQALSVNYKPQGVEIVLVSVDEVKDEPKARSYLKDNGITLRSYLVSGSIADFKQVINPRWPGMLPASFLFDGAARLVHFWGGEAFEEEVTPVVESFVAGRPIEAETNYGLAPGKVE